MKTDDEILARIEDLAHSDFFGTMRGDLLHYLSFNAAKPFLNEDVTPDAWDSFRHKADAESIRAEIADYMAFAWDKANDCRGLSAARSLDHMKAFLWMLGEDDVVDALGEYEYYGKPQLRAMCDHFGIDWLPLDNGIWRNSESEVGVDADSIDEISLPWRVAA